MFKTQSHRAYDQVTTYLLSKNVAIVGKSKKERTIGRIGRTTGRRGRGWSQGANQSQQGRWSCSKLVVPPYDRWHHESIAHAEFHD